MIVDDVRVKLVIMVVVYLILSKFIVFLLEILVFM